MDDPNALTVDWEDFGPPDLPLPEDSAGSGESSNAILFLCLY